MALFLNPALDEFRNNSDVVAALNGVRLYNLTEFNEWYGPGESRQSERITKEAMKSAPKAQKLEFLRQTSVNQKETIAYEVLLKLANTVCRNPITQQPAIGEGYGKHAIDNLKYKEFDILVAVDPGEIKTGRTKTVSQHKLEHVVGFIIAEYGECKKKPEVWSVNLICTTRTKLGYSIKGGLLMGAFLYCIKMGSYIPEAVLELADGYINTSGFFSYTKMGFNKDLSLYGDDCFSDSGNLPMSADLTNLDGTTIINRAIDKERRIVTEADDDSGLFNAGKISPSLQKKLVIYNDLLYRVQIAYDVIRREQYLRDDLSSTWNAMATKNFNRNQMIDELVRKRDTLLDSISNPAAPPLPPAANPNPNGSIGRWVCDNVGKCVFVAGVGVGVAALKSSGMLGGKTKRYRNRNSNRNRKTKHARNRSKTSRNKRYKK